MARSLSEVHLGKGISTHQVSAAALACAHDLTLCGHVNANDVLRGAEQKREKKEKNKKGCRSGHGGVRHGKPVSRGLRTLL